ncbi:glutathione S-transferase family protein [Polymorphobacter arshaanensis]|uniref:Glutathione S-transferase family protein n=1 Tax=Glacieibacterium arshaanense TaxID=2511025 RepID=A0A4Y9ERD9_9SPHN|nr:glutathione binding-like protein [Polymorphobacter arshaanensis]TFU05773.1 glutathione S-transferase family protein [Polymorphobacter arshaanensis]
MIPAQPGAPWRVHGLDLSYFTGKIEAYLRAKGIAYKLVEMDTAGFAACALATGVRQMPQIELGDGRWLTDTTPSMGWIEAQYPEPRIAPENALVGFVSRLIEDFGDEALWRPALYYRWAKPDDARLMSGRIAAGMLRDIKLPLALRRQFILRRQRHHYLRGEGVTAANSAAVEALYLDSLAVLEPVLATRDFIMGARPCEADFGLFASMFRHFFCDPTPAQIMRDRAPHVLAWVTRLWAISPDDFADAPALETVPADLAPLLALIGRDYLPYLAANAAACAAGDKTVRYTFYGGDFETRCNAYHAWCLDQLRIGFAPLAQSDHAKLETWLGADALAVLVVPRDAGIAVAQVLPIAAPPMTALRDRQWRS